MIKCYRMYDHRFVLVMWTSSDEVAVNWLMRQRQAAFIV